MNGEVARTSLHDRSLEWLEADGLGGFASGTPSGIRTRRYHGLLAVSPSPPTERIMLVNAVEASVDTGAGPTALSSHHYLPDVVHPDGASRLVAFTIDPLPRWTFELEDGTRVEHEVFVAPGAPRVVLIWRLVGARKRCRLTVRPLLSGRDLHALHHENASFCFEPTTEASSVRWHPYPDVPAIVARSNGVYRHDPAWYRNFLYAEERARGYDHVEDLASPGVLEFDLEDGDACLVIGAEAAGLSNFKWSADVPVERFVRELRDSELASRAGTTILDRAADAYIVKRGDGKTIIAGYPWFADWGRDTFVALRGLLIARGRLAEARSILLAWAKLLSHGMLPNRFPERDAPEFNSVDAALWFVVAVHEFLGAARPRVVRASERALLERAVTEILDHYARGTRTGIRADSDGLLACGEPGWQLTWMDAKVGEDVITPRIGKPVEIQALWINALAIGAGFDARWKPLEARARASFEARFWNEERGALYDVVDEDHVAGKVDASLRPNQILAVGGLPFAALTGARAHSVVDVVERELLTPLGLRTLAASDVRYAREYKGGPLERDRAYHQGTAWPWLLGPFVEAWVRVRGSTPRAVREARAWFLPPLHRHLEQGGLGHVSEIADAELPHTPCGCPFQAWSVGELVRLERVVLAPRPRHRADAASRVGAGTDRESA